MYSMRSAAVVSAILLLAACSAERPSEPHAPPAQTPAAAQSEAAAAAPADPHDHSAHDHAHSEPAAPPATKQTVAVTEAAARNENASVAESVLRKKPASGNLADTIADPFQFENPEIRETYQNAKLVADRLDKMYCYCRCKENEQLAHNSLLTCFQDDHAAHCGICLREAQQAFLDWKDELPLEVTVKAVDLMYNQGNPAPSMP